MHAESKIFESLDPEKKYPTGQDLEVLEIKAHNLGRGDLIHDTDSLIGFLRSVLQRAGIDGWSDRLLDSWNKDFGKLERIIHEAKLNRAKENGPV
jgi:hypothetical protein